MLRTTFPRVHELRDLTPDLSSVDAYFKDHERKLESSAYARDFYARIEESLQSLPQDQWQFLRGEAAAYLMKPHPIRGWSQLFNILCQADAFRYLQVKGCCDIRFIPRALK